MYFFMLLTTHSRPTYCGGGIHSQTHRELTAKLQRAAAAERQSAARAQEVESALARMRSGSCQIEAIITTNHSATFPINRALIAFSPLTPIFFGSSGSDVFSLFARKLGRTLPRLTDFSSQFIHCIRLTASAASDAQVAARGEAVASAQQLADAQVCVRV